MEKERAEELKTGPGSGYSLEGQALSLSWPLCSQNSNLDRMGRKWVGGLEEERGC